MKNTNKFLPLIQKEERKKKHCQRLYRNPFDNISFPANLRLWCDIFLLSSFWILGFRIILAVCFLNTPSNILYDELLANFIPIAGWDMMTFSFSNSICIYIKAFRLREILQGEIFRPLMYAINDAISLKFPYQVVISL